MKTRYFIFLTFSLWLITDGLVAQKPVVVSSASMFTDMVENIAGDLVETETIVPIGGDPHLHTPTPRDAKLVGRADLLLLNGLTFEGWINELVENSGTKAKTILITEGVEPISSDTYKNSTDPHAWMDLANGRIYIKNITNALKELDPSNAVIYESNYQSYDKKLEELDRYIFDKIKEIPEEKRILITSHDAFKYYGKRYGVKLEAIQGISTDSDVQTSDIKRVSYTINRYKVPALFVESTINPKLLKQIASDNDVKIGGKLYADSLGDKESAAATYLSMIRSNTNTIVEGLKGGAADRSDEVSLDDSNVGSNMIMYGIMGLLLLGGMLLLIKKLS